MLPNNFISWYFSWIRVFQNILVSQNTFSRGSFRNSLDLQIHYFTIHISKIHKIHGLPARPYIYGISLDILNWLVSPSGRQLNSPGNILNLPLERNEYINTWRQVYHRYYGSLKNALLGDWFKIYLICRFITLRQTYLGFRYIYSLPGLKRNLVLL